MSIIHRSSASGDASGVLTHEFARVWAGRRRVGGRRSAPRGFRSAAYGADRGVREGGLAAWLARPAGLTSARPSACRPSRPRRRCRPLRQRAAWRVATSDHCSERRSHRPIWLAAHGQGRIVARNRRPRPARSAATAPLAARAARRRACEGPNSIGWRPSVSIFHVLLTG
jgi:hypothetical protein